ncbi:MAG: DnaB-like helicase N-terminal domain-containing protein, partial [Nitrospinaceae bacterium]
MADSNDISLRKLPPYHEEAEQYVLSACLFSPDAIARALEVLNEEDFYKTSHRKIFAAMRRMFEGNEGIDVLTLAERLRRSHDLESAGGIDYLDVLEGLAPTAAAMGHHGKIVREKKILRSLIETATDIAASCYDDTEEADVVLDRAEQSIFKISERKAQRTFFSLRELVKSSFSAIEKLIDEPSMVTGLETGFTGLDELTTGFQPSDLIIVAGRPSMGKTSFALDIA